MENRGIERDVVVIYDDAGIPSIMRRFHKMTNKELFGGSDKTNAAFIIGGEEYDEIYLPVYEGSMIDGRMYSLPYTEPATNITLEEAEVACFRKGDGWHLMTAPEWGLLANISLRNGTLPHGNTAAGHYHADENERGQKYDNYRTLTGSGPRTWTHNHQIDGIHDLCGNVWELIRGIRLLDGRIQIAPNNDAALPIDLSRNGDGWVDMVDEVTGKPLFIHADGNISISTEKPMTGWTWDRWGDVKFEVKPNETMRELALFPGEPDAWIFADTNGKRCAYRGGCWGNGADNGVFALYFSLPRSYSDSHLGGRPAYFKKHRI